MTAPLAITILFTVFILLLVAFLPDPKDDGNDYNGKDSQP